jgi:hypothetical protein
MLLGANQYVSKLLAKPEATSRLLKRLDIFKQMPNLFIDDYTFWTYVTEDKQNALLLPLLDMADMAVSIQSPLHR